jgi:hypothetical protein
MSTETDAVLVPTGRRDVRAVVAALLRALLTTVGVLWVYAVAPTRDRIEPTSVVVLAGGLTVLLILLAVQVRAITRAKAPRLRAIEAMATVVPLFLVLFAVVYLLLAEQDPGAFSGPLSRLDAFYFTVTVFATVGFGDITAVSPAARIAVTVQMLANLVVLGLGVRLVFGAVRIGLAHRVTGPGAQ